MAYHYHRLPPARLTYRYLDQPASGFKVWSVLAGTSTLATTYQDKLGAATNANPIILDSNGQCVVWANVDLDLIFCLASSTGPTDGIIQSDPDYEFVSQINDVAAADTGTANNNYTASTTPLYSTLPDGFSLSFIPDTDNLDTLVIPPLATKPTVFVGTGFNDMDFSGPFTGTTPGSIFTVEVVSAGTPDTVRWKKDGGSWTSVAITADSTTPQIMIEGMAFTFAVSAGHTPGDVWTVEVMTPARLNFCGLGSDIIYKNVNGDLKALDGGDMIQDIPAHLDYSIGLTAWILLNPSLPVFENLRPTRARRQVTASGAVTIADWGKELSCINNPTLTLPAPPDVVNCFFYIKLEDGGYVIIDAGAGYVINGQGDYTGSQTLKLTGGLSCVQLATNGIDWHILSSDYTESPGRIAIIAKTTADDGWLLCNGASLAVADYPALHAAIGYSYGGAGANFNVPNLQGRFPLGKAGAGTGSVWADSGGNIDHNHSIPALPLGVVAGSGLREASNDAITDGPVNGGANAFQPTTGADNTGTANPPFLVINFQIKY